LSSFLPDAVYEKQDRTKGHQRSIANEHGFAFDTEFVFTRPGSEESCAQFHSVWKGMSPWSGSAAKRIFDCACVLLSLPVFLPLMLVIGVVVRLTSRGPILFLQERVGRYGRSFTILKFRTMVHFEDSAHHPITTSDNQRFTPVGPFLRRWKLDELPQLVTYCSAT
jgi:lipopolysaccharide/colanic/teichoic acid biosynthesis glycosyltransferase